MGLAILSTPCHQPPKLQRWNTEGVCNKNTKFEKQMLLLVTLPSILTDLTLSPL